MDLLTRDGTKQTTETLPMFESKAIASSTPRMEKDMTTAGAKEPLMKRLMRWIVPDQRVANRHAAPPLVAYLGLVRTSKVYKVNDISIAGFYMVTEERWIHGTGFPVTLERTTGTPGETLTLYCTVVRTGADGVGFSFLQPQEEKDSTQGRGPARLDLTKLAQFLNGIPLSEPTAEEL